MPTLKINDREITVADGTSVLRAALDHGIEIPHYCYHPHLTIAGSCRLCLVEIEGAPKLQLSCATPVKEGMIVRTDTGVVKDARRSMLEFFLINHPLDCPICDKAGECLLQDYTYRYGSAHSRMVEQKRERPTKDLGGRILLYRNRCVLCTRCVRFFTDVVGDPHLTVEHRGYHSDISVFPGRGLTHVMSGNVVEICPVGCLIDKDFLFHARVWNLKKTRSICPGCSTGCNITLEHKDNKIYRIRSRENGEVNGPWICDEGRYLYHRFENLDRPAGPQAGNEPLDWPAALDRIQCHFKELKSQGRMAEAAVAGSAFATMEENYLLRRIFGDVYGVGQFYLDPAPVGGSDQTFKSGFTIHTDRAPNTRGAQMVFDANGSLWTALAGNRIRTLVLIGGDVEKKLSAEQKNLLGRLEFFVVLDVQRGDLASAAHLFLPVPAFGEQEGTYVNFRGRLQRFEAALNPPAAILPAWRILIDLLNQLIPNTPWISPADVMNEMAGRLPPLKGLSYFKLADRGIQLEQA
jgi:NADH-quinone oxidoreductase subunit G